ncbi:hypothetical protein AB1Y20_014651 [Prymnesium parvum]|uniref:Carotenoid oxygenase n=1 Tax=Prymnesium parvum TaxID=97485 RepID=A0AB34IDG8_PRYPA
MLLLLPTRPRPQAAAGPHARPHARRFAPTRSIAPEASFDGAAAPEMPWDRSSFLRGYQTPAEICAREVLCAELPHDLRGTYYRCSPARFVGYDGRKVRQPFDADGMVSAISLDGGAGRAVVRQRFVATQGAKEERAAARTLYCGQFGNSLPLWRGGAAIKNLANTNCLYHAGKLLALWEASRPHLLEPLSLATVKEWDIDGILGHGVTDSFSAHPKVDTRGHLINFAYFGNPITGQTRVRFWEFAADSFSQRFPTQEYYVPGFGLFHDFAVTDNWLIVMASPTTWGNGAKPLEAMRDTFRWVAGKRPVTSMIHFEPSAPTTVRLFPRDPSSGRAPIAIELDTFFSFHHANAYEDEAAGTVTIDTVRTTKLNLGDSGDYAEREDRNTFLMEEMDFALDVPRTDLERYTFNLREKTYTRKPLSTRHLEFPTVAPSVSTRKHRYVYCTAGGSAAGVSPHSGVLKVDTADASRSRIWLPPTGHQFCGEVTFTPRQTGGAAAREDDGYLLTLCFDGRDGTSELLVFDAERVESGPIARVPVSTPDERLPPDANIPGPGHGLHATFVAGLSPTLREVQAAELKQTRLQGFLTSIPLR